MSRTIDPVSPPEVPITASSSGRRQIPGLRSQQGNIRHSLSASPRFSGTGSRDPRFSIPPGVASANGLPFRTTPFRPDELSPRSPGSSALSDITGHDLASKFDDDDEEAADGDDDNDDSDSDSVASGSVSKSSSSADLSSPPITSRPVPLQRRSGHASGSASPAYTPGGSRIKSGSGRRPSISAAAGQSTTRLFVFEAALIIEEVSDFDSDNGRIQVIQPYEIEEAESEREKTPDPNQNRSGKFNMAKARRRSSARLSQLPEIDRSVMSGLREFSFGANSDEDVLLDEEDGSDFDEIALNSFLSKHRDERRRRRMTSGSISKRTITESIGSDTDNEDLNAMLDASEVGSSARRLRRRIGDRHSLQFQDPPPPRIDELEEPDTTDNEDDVKELIRDGETLARELPYYTLEYISMEVDSP
ncbi:hypothetical protein SEUCBS139899_004565 [Sporothrix eucalyptigena]|uniref:Uncharacterized protein n=1 Tax=Sporothrix eucalyptigena TaxID=1812306 RepID=A0ABP0CI89_9PEZI